MLLPLYGVEKVGVGACCQAWEIVGSPALLNSPFEASLPKKTCMLWISP